MSIEINPCMLTKMANSPTEEKGQRTFQKRKERDKNRLDSPKIERETWTRYSYVEQDPVVARGLRIFVGELLNGTIEEAS